MNIETKKCKAVLPGTENYIDYRQRLLHHIIAKFIGQQTIIAKGNEIHYTATPEQEIKIQTVIDVCTEELDYAVQNIVFALVRNKGMLAPKDYVLDIKEVA